MLTRNFCANSKVLDNPGPYTDPDSFNAGEGVRSMPCSSLRVPEQRMTDLWHDDGMRAGQELPARPVQDSCHWRWWSRLRASDELGAARYVRLISV